MQTNNIIDNEQILKALTEMGFTEFSEIQKQAIPRALSGKDIVGQAQTGTGKTASFVIPVLLSLNTEQKTIQSLMVVPTRELALQINEEIKKIGRYMNVSSVALYGGESYDRQLRLLKANPQIVVSTPGRLIDLLKRKKIKVKNINTFILDEMDEMLNMGFIDDIVEIITYLPEERQNLFFSATLPQRIKAVIAKFTANPEYIKVAAKSLTVDKVTQFYMITKSMERFDQLVHQLYLRSEQKVIIFTQTKRDADDIANKLTELKFNVDKIHGDIPQQTRTTTMNRFRHDKFNILIATDVLARGIDVDGINLVINFGLSQEMEYYIHRIGRTGRGNSANGESITLVTPNEFNKEFKFYEKKLKTKITEIKKPTINERNEQLKVNYLNSLNKDIKKKEVPPIYQEFTNQLLDTHHPAEIIDYLLSQAFPNLAITQDQLEEEKRNSSKKKKSNNYGDNDNYYNSKKKKSYSGKKKSNSDSYSGKKDFKSDKGNNPKKKFNKTKKKTNIKLK